VGSPTLQHGPAVLAVAFDGRAAFDDFVAYGTFEKCDP
jgi:hypothetical protein